MNITLARDPDKDFPDDYDQPEPQVVTLANVTPERVSWLWPGYLPLGKLVVFDGDPSVGKSTLTNDLAARCSTGDAWPDGSGSGVAHDVLIMTAEDGLGDTVRPRLDAAGADCHRVHALLSVPVRDDDGYVHDVPPTLPRDIPRIERIIDDHHVRLVVVDVLMAYLNGHVDAHRDQDVRGVLAELAAMAERTGCCVVLVRHLNKTPGGSAMYRGGGSIGIIGAARAGFIVARDPEDNDRRLFVCVKSNLAVEPPALAYRLISDEVNDCARIEWEPGPVDITANEVLRAPLGDEERGARNEAEAWLSDYLADCGGTATASDGFKAAAAAGISRDAIRHVRARVADTVKLSMDGGWVWQLRVPEERTKSAKSAALFPLRSSHSSVRSSGDPDDSLNPQSAEEREERSPLRSSHSSRKPPADTPGQLELIELPPPPLSVVRNCPDCGVPLSPGYARCKECRKKI